MLTDSQAREQCGCCRKCGATVPCEPAKAAEGCEGRCFCGLPEEIEDLAQRRADEAAPAQGDTGAAPREEVTLAQDLMRMTLHGAPPLKTTMRLATAVVAMDAQLAVVRAAAPDLKAWLESDLLSPGEECIEAMLAIVKVFDAPDSLEPAASPRPADTPHPASAFDGEGDDPELRGAGG